MSLSLDARVRLADVLRDAEGDRQFPYDDATGQPPMTQGKLTIGVGRNLTDRGLSLAERSFLLDNDLTACEHEVLETWPWASTLDGVRFAVLVELAFNLGVPKLKAFAPTLERIRTGLYDVAAERLLNTKWAKDVKARRATRVTRQLRTGQWA